MSGKIRVSHFVGFSGVGGVQRNFSEFLDYEYSNDSPIRHTVYTLGLIDAHYKLPVEVRDIHKLGAFFALIRDLISSDRVVHFYNNLTSPKVALFLLLLPVRKLVMHERGTAWNCSHKRAWIVRLVARKAAVILANSRATRTMLSEKFSIPLASIRVIYNGINVLAECSRGADIHKGDSLFRVGFMGRFDTPKGIHVLIEAMRLLVNKPVTLWLAGEGVLEGALKDQARELDKVKFVGRVDSPYLFLNQLDLLVVPSLREPFGNVCIEAGLCRVPVVASQVDGIPEIIENGVSGELIEPTMPVDISFPRGAVPLPEWIVNAHDQILQRPLQLDPRVLAETIIRLSNQPHTLVSYARELHKQVITLFSLSRYSDELYSIYCDVMNSS